MSTFKVTVCEIESVTKHENADVLDIVTLKGLGWQVITGRVGDKTQPMYKPGDRCIYVPIDSLLPEIFENFYCPPGSKITFKNHRVKTEKIRGSYSQGLVVDLSPELLTLYPELAKVKVGDDVTSVLRISKYEPPAPTFSRGCLNARRVTEGFDKYTGIENLKNFPNTFKNGDLVVVTEKIHGTNFRCGKIAVRENKILKFFRWLLGLGPKHTFVVGSHNVELDPNQDNLYTKIAKRYMLQHLLKPGEVVYGEIYGHSIQKNYVYDAEPGTPQLRVFDVKVGGVFLSHDGMMEFCKVRSLPTVPVLYKGYYADEMVQAHKVGDSKIGGQKVREGCVVKLRHENQVPPRKILKAINEKYLEKDQTEFH